MFDLPEIIPHSGEEEQPIIIIECTGYKGGCLNW
jgi:hypothetical protein